MKEEVKDKQPSVEKNSHQTKSQQEHLHESAQVPPQTVSIKDYENLKNQANMYLNTARQLQADFENYKRHNKDAKKDGIEEGIKKACETILPALDSFKKAKKVIDDKKCLEGINLIEKTLLESLKQLKVERIATVGEKFNPEYHNAVVLVEDLNAKSNTIVEEIQAGYTYNGKVIRYSQVVVAK